MIIQFGIYTILKGQKYYFDRNNDTFGLTPRIYDYEDNDVLMCTLLDAGMKITEMEESLLAAGLGKYRFDLFIHSNS